MPRKKKTEETEKPEVVTSVETSAAPVVIPVVHKHKDSGRIVYGCRRCGEVFYENESLNSIKHELARYTMNAYKQTFKIHDCDDGNIGLGEIIGAEYDK